VDHIPLLQALLAEWRRELGRKPLAMSEGEALQVLGITPGPDGVVSEDELRRAYRCDAWLGHATVAAVPGKGCTAPPPPLIQIAPPAGATLLSGSLATSAGLSKRC
jgi:hypothetical protein